MKRTAKWVGRGLVLGTLLFGAHAAFGATRASAQCACKITGPGNCGQCCVDNGFCTTNLVCICA